MATVIGSRMLFAVAVAALSACATTADVNDDRQLFAVENRVSQLEHAIGKRSTRMQSLNQEMRQIVDALMAPDTDTTNRLFLMERSRSIAEEQARLQTDIQRLNTEIATKRAELEALRHSLTASSGYGSEL
jgi:predicted  nucleic acid-binding Zn-ribbon protein